MRRALRDGGGSGSGCRDGNTDGWRAQAVPRPDGAPRCRVGVEPLSGARGRGGGGGGAGGGGEDRRSGPAGRQSAHSQRREQPLRVGCNCAGEPGVLGGAGCGSRRGSPVSACGCDRGLHPTRGYWGRRGRRGAGHRHDQEGRGTRRNRGDPTPTGALVRADAPDLPPLHVRARCCALPRGWIVATDDASAVERLGAEVRMVPASATNLKITRPEDVPIAEALAAGGLV